MKILAIEKEVENADWKNLGDLLREEAHHVFNLYQANLLREIYFTENKNAVLVMETADKNSAEKLLNDLPLVKSGIIKFDVIELKPYTGFERLIIN